MRVDRKTEVKKPEADHAVAPDMSSLHIHPTVADTEPTFQYDSFESQDREVPVKHIEVEKKGTNGSEALEQELCFAQCYCDVFMVSDKTQGPLCASALEGVSTTRQLVPLLRRVSLILLHFTSLLLTLLHFIDCYCRYLVT